MIMKTFIFLYVITTIAKCTFNGMFLVERFERGDLIYLAGNVKCLHLNGTATQQNGKCVCHDDTPTIYHLADEKSKTFSLECYSNEKICPGNNSLDRYLYYILLYNKLSSHSE